MRDKRPRAGCEGTLPISSPDAFVLNGRVKPRASEVPQLVRHLTAAECVPLAKKAMSSARFVQQQRLTRSCTAAMLHRSSIGRCRNKARFVIPELPEVLVKFWPKFDLASVMFPTPRHLDNGRFSAQRWCRCAVVSRTFTLMV